MAVTEEQWRTAAFGLWLMQTADAIRLDEDGEWTEWWRSIAARVACFRRLGPHMPDGVRRWIAEAEEYLDGEDRRLRGEWLLFPRRAEVYRAFRQAFDEAGPELRQRLAAAQDVFHGTDYYGYEDFMLDDDEAGPTYTGPVYLAESAAQCDIIRCVFGNPFRPVALDPSWRSDTAVSLARQMYESRDFGAVPILADAMQDAGCDDAAILEHCRADGRSGGGTPHGFPRAPSCHVRGCWVVDLVLDKG